MNNLTPLEMINSFFTDPNSKVTPEELALAQTKLQNDNNKNKDIYFKKCKHDFGAKTWEHLDDTSKNHIVSAYRSCQQLIIDGLQFAKSLEGLAQALECELKYKIFNDFNNYIFNYIDEFKEAFDRDYIECLKKGFVPAAMLLTKLRFVSNYNPKGISGELKEFLEYDNWNLYLLSNKEAIDKAFEVVNIRGENGHEGTEDNVLMFERAKNKTKNVLEWFISSYLNE